VAREAAVWRGEALGKNRSITTRRAASLLANLLFQEKGQPAPFVRQGEMLLVSYACNAKEFLC
jgi:hypothetical protein